MRDNIPAKFKQKNKYNVKCVEDFWHEVEHEHMLLY